MIIQRNSKLYRIVNYQLREYEVIENNREKGYKVRDIHSHKIFQLRTNQSLENWRNDIEDGNSNYSLVKIELLYMLREQLEKMFHKATYDLIEFKDNFYEKSKKFNNLKFITKEQLEKIKNEPTDIKRPSKSY